ncbi:MAG: FecR domain-containing protein [Paracoccaceae bacterium]
MKHFAIIFLAVVAALVADGQARADERRSCAVARIEGGDARIWSGGAWRPIGREPLPDAAVKVATGPNTRLEIACDDGVVITIGVATEANLEDLTGPSGRSHNIVIQLIDGVLGLVAPIRTWAGFHIRTPLAIASVRSTEWLVSHGMGGPGAIFVREGRVAVRALGSAAKLSLGSGEGVDISASGTPGRAKKWGAARVEATGALLGLGWR